MKGELNKVDNGWVLMVNNIMYATDKDKLSTKNCQTIENGYDLDELAYNWVFETNGHKWSNNDDTAGDNYCSFKAGFQKAIELMNDKKYTEECVRNAYFNGEKDSYVKGGQTKEMENEFIQSLQQTKWDVEIEMEPYHDGEFVDNGKTCIVEPKWKPLLDENGCLILKRL